MKLGNKALIWFLIIAASLASKASYGLDIQFDSFTNHYYSETFDQLNADFADRGIEQRFQARFMESYELDSSGKDTESHGYIDIHYELASTTVIYKNTGAVPDFAESQFVNVDGLYRLDDLTPSHEFNTNNTFYQNLDRLSYTTSLSYGDFIIGRQAITFGISRFSNQTDVLYPLSVGSLVTDYRQGVDAIRFEMPQGDLGLMEGGWVQGSNAKNSAGFYRFKMNYHEADYELTAIQLYKDTIFTLGSQHSWQDYGLWQELSLIKDEKTKGEKIRFTIGLDNRHGDYLYSLEYHRNELGVSDPRQYTANAQSSGLYLKGAIPLLAKDYVFLSADYLEGSRHQLSMQLSSNLNDKSQLFSVIYGFNINQQWDLTAQTNVPIDYWVDDQYKNIAGQSNATTQRAEFLLLNQLISLNLKSVF